MKFPDARQPNVEFNSKRCVNVVEAAFVIRVKGKWIHKFFSQILFTVRQQHSEIIFANLRAGGVGPVCVCVCVCVYTTDMILPNCQNKIIIQHKYQKAKS